MIGAQQERRRDQRRNQSTHDDVYLVSEPGRSGSVFGVFLAMLLIGSVLVSGPWAGFHGVLFACTGLLILLFPPVVALPRWWWALAGCFLLFAATSFLPAAWFAAPAWRGTLESLGLSTGSRVVIQSRYAAETLTFFGIMLFTGLWLAGHRPSSAQLRIWAMAFTIGVAAYAILGRLMQHSPLARQNGMQGLFGFFPNRNHTATYLAMGSICGLGCMLQALRDRRFLSLAVAIAATGVCLWAVAGWSLSRGGLVLVAIGSLVWLSILGTQYLGANGRRAVSLIALAIIGVFFIVDTGAKERISQTVEKASGVFQGGDTGAANVKNAATAIDEIAAAQAKTPSDSAQKLDFRIPTALDTLDLIRDFPWTGVGAGQYRFVFPQYRKRTAVGNNSDSYHPESDWLWMAAETGIPATIALAALVILACWKSLRSILTGRERALRGACLVAAMLVPIHGLFDVPGHRITLAWSAALLFALSLRAPATDRHCQPVRIPSPWPFRAAALVLLAAAAFLIRAQWAAGPQPAFVIGDLSTKQAFALYREDQARQKAAVAAGEIYAPTPEDDLLEHALVPLEQTVSLVPLHRLARHLQGFIALHFQDENFSPLIHQSFALELALDPTWVAAPLHQSLAWSNTDPAQAARLWDIALERARRLDQLHPGSAWSVAATRSRISQMVHGKPALEALWNNRPEN